MNSAAVECSAVVLVPFTRPVRRALLVRRYKRFLVDVVLQDGLDQGQTVTAHTANTGAMTGLLRDGAPVLLTDHEGSGRRLRYEVEAIEVLEPHAAVGTHAAVGPHASLGRWVSVTTLAANAFAQRAIEQCLIPELAGYASVRREVAPSARSRSRFDLLLEDVASPVGRARCFVEVKSVTLRERSQALFPDAVTVRGRKHLDALARLVSPLRKLGKGERAVMLYVNKRAGCEAFRAAASIDPRYASALRRAAKAGVEILCVNCNVDERGLSFAGRLRVDLT